MNRRMEGLMIPQDSDKQVIRLTKMEPMELLQAIQPGEVDLLLGLEAIPE